jgi:hypothetical protein
MILSINVGFRVNGISSWVIQRRGRIDKGRIGIVHTTTRIIYPITTIDIGIGIAGVRRIIIVIGFRVNGISSWVIQRRGRIDKGRIGIVHSGIIIICPITRINIGIGIDGIGGI